MEIRSFAKRVELELAEPNSPTFLQERVRVTVAPYDWVLPVVTLNIHPVPVAWWEDDGVNVGVRFVSELAVEQIQSPAYTVRIYPSDTMFYDGITGVYDQVVNHSTLFTEGSIFWGDGTGNTLVEPDGPYLNYTYPGSGTYEIQMSWTFAPGVSYPILFSGTPHVTQLVTVS